MRVLITGAKGQLGTGLVETAPEHIELISHTREDFDLRNIDKLEKFLINLKPDIVINTAAFHDTEKCEDHFEEAILMNAVIPSIMARITNSYGGAIVFISTDYVFDGKKKGELYYEVDGTNPLNKYGLSKLMGEIATKKLNERHYIFRLASLFGKTRRKNVNFVLKILERARKGEILKVVNDIYMTPTYAHDAALRIWKVIEGDFGTYHVTNSGVTSWYDFAVEILKIKGVNSQITPVSHKERQTKVKRPLWSPLGSKFLPPMRHWKEALKDYLKEITWI